MRRPQSCVQCHMQIGETGVHIKHTERLRARPASCNVGRKQRGREPETSPWLPQPGCDPCSPPPAQKPSAWGKQEASHGKQSLWIHGMYFGIWGKTDIYQQGLKISGSVSQTMQSHRGH